MAIKRGRPHPSTLHRHPVLSLSSSPEPSRRGSPGNNKFGARGTLKCLNCRNRKARCEFLRKEDDCRWCAQRGLVCGEKLLGEKHQIREHRKLLGIGNVRLSVIAQQLELAYPRLTPWEISEMAREALVGAGDGPPSETMSHDGINSKSVTPHIDPPESVKLENSPKTPTLTLQSQRFLSASQKTPPRSTRPEPRKPSINIDQLPTYDYSAHLSIPPAGRPHYEERDHQLYDANYFAERIMDTGPWSLHQSLTWQESV